MIQYSMSVGKGLEISLNLCYSINREMFVSMKGGVYDSEKKIEHSFR